MRTVTIEKDGNNYTVNPNATPSGSLPLRVKLMFGESAVVPLVENTDIKPSVPLLGTNHFLDVMWDDGTYVDYNVVYEPETKAAILYSLVMNWGEYTLFKIGEQAYVVEYDSSDTSIFNEPIPYELDTSLELPYLEYEGNRLPVGEASTITAETSFGIYYYGSDFGYVVSQGYSIYDDDLTGCGGHYEDVTLYSGDIIYMTFIVLDTTNHKYNICKYQVQGE